MSKIDLERLRRDAMCGAVASGVVLDLMDLVAALEKDAARYRWLARKVSGHGVCDGWAFGFPTHLSLPAPALVIKDPAAALGQAIDTAMEASNAKAD